MCVYCKSYETIVIYLLQSKNAPAHCKTKREKTSEEFRKDLRKLLLPLGAVSWRGFVTLVNGVYHSSRSDTNITVPGHPFFSLKGHHTSNQGLHLGESAAILAPKYVGDFVDCGSQPLKKRYVIWHMLSVSGKISGCGMAGRSNQFGGHISGAIVNLTQNCKSKNQTVTVLKPTQRSSLWNLLTFFQP